MRRDGEAYRIQCPALTEPGRYSRGVDTVAERRQQRPVISKFRKAAELRHKEHEKAWKNGKHQAQWLATLKT